MHVTTLFAAYTPRERIFLQTAAQASHRASGSAVCIMLFLVAHAQKRATQQAEMAKKDKSNRTIKQ
jgi:hypothetical protein